MSAWAICGYLWTVFAVTWIVMALRTKPVEHRESISSRLSYMLFVLAAFYLVFGKNITQPWLRIHLFEPGPISDWKGVAVTAAGIGFAIWARLYLGGNWSGTVTVKVNHELVRTGPYRLVRHPIYTGLILALLGTALLLGRVRGLIAILLLYVGFKIKSKIEEQAMINTFGAEYHEYSRNTGAIVPKLRS
jgi:protein-S-isoprenylcysteine O-methyltransferase Ste14